MLIAAIALILLGLLVPRFVADRLVAQLSRVALVLGVVLLVVWLVLLLTGQGNHVVAGSSWT